MLSLRYTVSAHVPEYPFAIVYSAKAGSVEWHWKTAQAPSEIILW
jgi:hypothetical protein